jgi:hypothetical protein
MDRLGKILAGLYKAVAKIGKKIDTKGFSLLNQAALSIVAILLTP